MVIFHLGGGVTGFWPGRVNQVTMPEVTSRSLGSTSKLSILASSSARAFDSSQAVRVSRSRNLKAIRYSGSSGEAGRNMVAPRSEERRVGKECGVRGGRDDE